MADESPEVIKAQMEQTRLDLANKIETLEQTVAQTVHDATSAVTSTVGAVQEAVGSTTDAVKDVLGSTTDAVQSTVNTVKNTFDLKAHVESSPWLMLGGAVMTGFVLGKVLHPLSQSPSPSWPQSWSGFNGSSGPAKEADKAPEKKEESGIVSGLMSFLQKPLDIAQGVAVGSLFTMVRDVLKQSLPTESWSKELIAVVDDLNQQLGGQPLQPSKDSEKSDNNQHNGDTNDANRNGSKVAGSVGATDRQGQESVGTGYRR